MATQTRYANGTGDYGNWTNTSWIYVYNADGSDYASLITTSTSLTDKLLYTFDVFSIPVGSTITKLEIKYRAREWYYGAPSHAQLCSGLKVGGSYYYKTLANMSTSFTDYTDSYTTNPRTSSAWTTDDINGSGSNALQQFGFQGKVFYVSGSAYSTLGVDQVYAVVTYTEPTTFSFSHGGPGSGYINSPGNYGG